MELQTVAKGQRPTGISPKSKDPRKWWEPKQ